VSYVDELVAAYRKTVSLPWQQNLAPPQRVWMAVYPAEHERRLRLPLHLTDFAAATKDAHHTWSLIDITTSFEKWMAGHEYRDQYFGSPELLGTALPAFFDQLVAELRGHLDTYDDPNGVIGLLGAGALFGLGDGVKVSALLNAVNDAIRGRLLVFFPGEAENNNFRLLDGRDGWDYMALVIKPNGGGR
jgi:hypothetical protein